MSTSSYITVWDLAMLGGDRYHSDEEGCTNALAKQQCANGLRMCVQVVSQPGGGPKAWMAKIEGDSVLAASPSFD